MNLLCGVLALAQSVRRSAPEFFGPIAQRLEQTTHNRLVGGSNPSGPTILIVSPAKDQLIFDDGCGFCSRSVHLLLRLDWFKTITPVPLSAAGDLLARNSIPLEAMMNAMHLVTRDGRVFAGVEAVRMFGTRIPLLFPLALAMRLGFVMRLTKWVYKKISGNRYAITRMLKCEGESCSLHRDN